MVFVVLRTDGREVECFLVEAEGGLSSRPMELASISLKTHLTESTVLCRLRTSTHLYLSEGQPGMCRPLSNWVPFNSVLFEK